MLNYIEAQARSVLQTHLQYTCLLACEWSAKVYEIQKCERHTPRAARMGASAREGEGGGGGKGK